MTVPLDDAAFVAAMAHKSEVDMGYLPIRVEDRNRLVALAREGVAGREVRIEHKLHLERVESRLADAEARVREVEEALVQIAKGEGRFSLDHFQHAKNTIEDMKVLAVTALARRTT